MLLKLSQLQDSSYVGLLNALDGSFSQKVMTVISVTFFYLFIQKISQIGMPIPGDFHSSGIRGMAICHSLGIGETKTYYPGSSGNLEEYFVSDLKSI